MGFSMHLWDFTLGNYKIIELNKKIFVSAYNEQDIILGPTEDRIDSEACA